jgi:hypothetical protein
MKFIQHCFFCHQKMLKRKPRQLQSLYWQLLTAKVYIIQLNCFTIYIPSPTLDGSVCMCEVH